MTTLLLIEPNGQLMMTPGMSKCYSNKEYKVYKSSFDKHNYVVLRRKDQMCALASDYTTNHLKFDHKLQSKIK